MLPVLNEGLGAYAALRELVSFALQALEMSGALSENDTGATFGVHPKRCKVFKP